ncbi:MAG: family 43 glycosylhydrolase [Bacteroidales bacterium]|nr:family 43 glycosylhydrolase [Bacteroidales bacterium]
MKNLRTMITLLLLAAFSVAVHLSAVGQVIQNDVFWHDTEGNPIYSQGGGVLKVGNTYYWYGARYRGAITYYNNPYSGKNGDTYFEAITCYSSTDLANWKYEGDVMTPADGLQAGWVGRIGCAYNANTRKYVLIAQMYPGLSFGTSSTPTGRFTLAATQSVITNVVNDMTGDQSVFTDDDGQAYLAFCNVEGRNNQYIARLRPSDYLYVEPATRIHRASSGREGNVLFKHNGTYYFISSDLHGWNTSQTYCITATNIWGPYSTEFVIQNTEKDYSHVTQSGLAVTVNGSSGSFVIFGGDRWADFAGNGVGYNQWCPISFNGTTPIFHSLSQWNINASAGTWSVGSGNNYILNPNFEADRIDVSDMTGWTNWVGSGSNPNGNLQNSHFPGRFCMEQYSSGAYEASMFQNISLPNGSYTFKAWVKSSGGQPAARVYVKGFGGSEKSYSINHSIGSWTEISISNINVTNGSIEVGVYSNANGGNWVNLDDFSLISDNSNPCTPTAITPYLQIDGGSWSGASSATLDIGQTIKFGPQPVSGGSWSWSGPNNFSASSREVTITNIQTNQAGNYVATFTNSCGAESSVTYNITVSGGGTFYPVIHSYSSEQSGNPASNILDGNNGDDSRWSAETYPEWVIVDYGANKSITGTRVWTYLDRAYQYTIELDDNTGFTSPYTVNRSSNTSSSQPISDDFPAQTARYARITVTGASGYTGSWVSLTEFSIVEGTSIPVTLTIQENEAGFCSVDGTVDSDHSGYTGTGFANTNNAAGNGVTWSVNVPFAQSCQVVWRFSNGGSTARTTQIKVNGSVAVSSFSMPSTGNWDTWSETSQQSLNLSAGNNLIRLEATNSSGLPNIDYMKITGTSLTSVSCNGLKSTSMLGNKEKGLDIICYPVPVNDELNIVFNKELTETVNIMILNAAGETLYSNSLNNGLSYEVNMADLPNGLYLIRIRGTNVNITKHIIKL